MATRKSPNDDLGNEEELGGRPAFLFAAGEQLAVSLDSSGANLPNPPSGDWVLIRGFRLGVRDVALPDMPPEPIIRGIAERGYHIWRRTDPSHMPASYSG